MKTKSKILDRSILERQAHSCRLREEYKKVPIIVISSTVELTKQLFLCPSDMLVATLMNSMKKHMGTTLPEEGCYLLINNEMINNTQTVGALDNLYQGEDGFLVVSFEKENCFGC